MRLLKAVLLLTIVSVMLPASAYAQATLSGVVKDASGAVLPGVTVEASSPVLIEKTRSTVTDGTGQYRLTELLPGTYTVTFTLSGFATIKRDAVEVTGAGVITIGADMRVGAVSETITVTGETPIVDVQTSTQRQTVLDDSVVRAVPASRNYGNLMAAVPGISSNAVDIGQTAATTFFTSRGGAGNEGTIRIDGMNVGSAFNGGGVAGFGYDTANATEVQVTISGGLGDTDRGGPQFNMVPRTGGNTFAGSFFGSTAGSWSQGNNLDDRLKSFGLTTPPTIIRNWDTNVALGGPIKRDRLWFFGNLRTYGNINNIAGFFANKNQGNATSWFYEKDPNVVARAANSKNIGSIRLTGQVTPKNKVNFYYDYQANCGGSALVKGAAQCRDRGDDWVALGGLGGFGPSTAPESGNVWDDREKITQATWTSTVTSRLLLEAGVSQFSSRWGGYPPGGALLDFIPVTELSATAGPPVPNMSYRGWASAASNDQKHNVWRASMSYVTGAHSLKVGYQAAYQVSQQFQRDGSNALAYTFNNRVPTTLTMRIAPHAFSNRTRYDAIYVQDQWTRDRLTLQGGLRYEHAWSWFPGGENGIVAPSRFMPVPFTFPESKGVTGYHDITPRMGAAYDVFGNGKTSIKVNVSKYLEPANNDGTFITGNPGVTFQQTTTRGWTDANGNYVADCNLMSPVANGECQAWANLNFGNPLVTTRVNPDVLSGSGKRRHDWQYGVSVQQEVAPRVSVDIGYNRRSWGTFYLTDNLAIGPSDFRELTIPAPSHPSLPNGGGYPVSVYVRNANSPLGAVNNYFTVASDYGDVTAYWHGVDIGVSARMSNGLTFQGGTSSGKGVRDTCAVTAKVPEMMTPAFFLAAQQISSCRVDEPWLTSFRGLVIYTVPKVDVLMSASIRSQPNISGGLGRGDFAAGSPGVLSIGTNGPSLGATYNAFNPALAPGEPFRAVNLLTPGVLYPDRINSIDLRFGKILRFGRTRTNVALDLYNLLNKNTGTVFNQAFGADGATWLRPTTILNPRFVRFNVTVDF